MANFKINGLDIVAGRSVTISNGRIVIDGRDVTPDGKTISIHVEGDVSRIEADACNTITVTGNAGPVKTMSGDVEVGGDINGDVKTMSGDVDCKGGITGGASSMSGDIRGVR